MKPGLKIAVVLFGLAGVLTQFTNCDVYSDSSVFGKSSSSSCLGSGCMSSNAEMLELASPVELIEASTSISFDVGGDCNEGAYPNNTVNWQLYFNNGLLADCKATNSCGQCVNGRYQVRPSFAGGATLASYPGAQVVLEIIGIDNAGSQYPGRPALSRRTVNVRLP